GPAKQVRPEHVVPRSVEPENRMRGVDDVLLESGSVRGRSRRMIALARKVRERANRVAVIASHAVGPAPEHEVRRVGRRKIAHRLREAEEGDVRESETGIHYGSTA